MKTKSKKKCTATLKKMKYISIYLSRYVQDLYPESSNILMNKLLKSLSEWIHSVVMDRKPNVKRMISKKKKNDTNSF
jgi:hypothetical protein